MDGHGSQRLQQQQQQKQNNDVNSSSLSRSFSDVSNSYSEKFLSAFKPAKKRLSLEPILIPGLEGIMSNSGVAKVFDLDPRTSTTTAGRAYSSQTNERRKFRGIGKIFLAKVSRKHRYFKEADEEEGEEGGEEENSELLSTPRSEMTRITTKKEGDRLPKHSNLFTGFPTPTPTDTSPVNTRCFPSRIGSPFPSTPSSTPSTLSDSKPQPEPKVVMSQDLSDNILPKVPCIGEPMPEKYPGATSSEIEAYERPQRPMAELEDVEIERREGGNKNKIEKKMKEVSFLGYDGLKRSLIVNQADPTSLITTVAVTPGTFRNKNTPFLMAMVETAVKCSTKQPRQLARDRSHLQSGRTHGEMLSISLEVKKKHRKNPKKSREKLNQKQRKKTEKHSGIMTRPTHIPSEYQIMRVGKSAPPPAAVMSQKKKYQTRKPISISISHPSPATEEDLAQKPSRHYRRSSGSNYKKYMWKYRKNSWTMESQYLSLKERTRPPQVHQPLLLQANTNAEATAARFCVDSHQAGSVFRKLMGRRRDFALKSVCNGTARYRRRYGGGKYIDHPTPLKRYRRNLLPPLPSP